MDSIVPIGYATTVYDSAGNLTDTLVTAGSNREEATYDELPQDLINAFVAIEDSASGPTTASTCAPSPVPRSVCVDRREPRRRKYHHPAAHQEQHVQWRYGDQLR